jgi:nitrite reductase/ring-hydroxylating ferredoxin subunit
MSDRDPWVPAFTLEELPVGGARVFAREDRRVAVFRTGEDEAFAVDDRCPHEGYPLARGYVKDCVVTCIWHNFKFDLRDGHCVMGDEHVRSYPLRISGGRVELDLTDPDPTLELARRYASLERGLTERKLGQVARDVVRLLQLGESPAALALAAARFDAAYAEYGTTHALPVAVDALALTERYPGVAAALPLMQAFDLASESHVRLARRVVPEPVDPGDDAAAAGERVCAAVEAEDAGLAEGLLRGALMRGWGRAEVEPWFHRMCAAHLLDFGHAVIYQAKVFGLLERVGWDHAIEVLPAYLHRIVSGTREELVPGWRWLCGKIAEYEPRFAGWVARNGSGVRDPSAGLELLAALRDGSREQVVAALVATLERGAGLVNVTDALVLGGAERLLRFDATHDADPTVQEGWLDVTHRLTFTHAVARMLERFAEPAALRLVFFAANFVHLAAALDVPAERRGGGVEAAAGTTAEAVAAVVDAVRGRDAGRAVARAAGYLASEHPVDALRVALEDLALRDPATRPIFVGHLIKTGVVAFAAHAELAGHPGRDVPVLAYVRYFASPAQERSLARQVHEAIGFVVHGKVPRTLT